MDTRRKEVYKIYLPLLKTDLLNEDTSRLLESQDYTNNEAEKKLIENYTGCNETNDPFISTVAWYYDARHHNCPNIEGILISDYKQKILADIDLFQKWIAAISSHESQNSEESKGR